MNYISVATGISAETLAWRPLGMKPVAFAQFDPEHKYKSGPDFASAVLAHHYPDVRNLGDMTKFEEWPDYANIDVLTGGTPCQSYSVAGLGAGLDDPRGDLALTYAAIARRYRPAWVVWENVGGVLSNHKGSAFGAILGLLSGQRIETPSGGWKTAGVVPGIARAYGLAWRVFDTQYVRVDGFGRAIPQRRRRVFVVGYLGDWRRAAAVLFEREGLSGNPPPRRRSGEIASGTIRASAARRGGIQDEADASCLIADVAPTISAREKGGGGLGTDFDLDGGLIPVVANPLTARMHKGVNTTMDEGQTMVPIAFKASHYTRGKDGAPVDVALPLSADADKGDQDQLICAPIAASLTAGGANVNGKGGFQPRFARNGRGMPIEGVAYPLTAEAGRTGKGDSAQCVAFQENQSYKGISQNGGHDAWTNKADAEEILRGVREEIGAQAFAEWGLGILDSLQPTEILRSVLHGGQLRPTAFSRRWIVDCALSCEEDRSKGAMQSMREAVGFGCSPQGSNASKQLGGKLGAYLSELSQPGAQAERFMHDLWCAGEGIGILHQALSEIQEARRRSPREGESASPAWSVRRLMPTEAEFLQGCPRGYTAIQYRGKPAADGPRYKVLGNMQSVNVVRWIGTRIKMVEGLKL